MKLYRVIVPVADIDRAAAYYEALLDRRGQRVSTGRHYLDCEGTILALYSPREDGDSVDQRWTRPSRPVRGANGRSTYGIPSTIHCAWCTGRPCSPASFHRGTRRGAAPSGTGAVPTPDRPARPGSSRYTG